MENVFGDRRETEKPNDFKQCSDCEMCLKIFMKICNVYGQGKNKIGMWSITGIAAHLLHIHSIFGRRS